MKKLKTEKGITLVALLVTIVILIILAVVAITTIMNTDILGYADKSVDIYEKNKDNESETMQGYEDYLNTNGGSGYNGESSSTGNILTVLDKAESTAGFYRYNAENGIVHVTGPISSWAENGYYGDPWDNTNAGFWVQSSCELKKR